MYGLIAVIPPLPPSLCWCMVRLGVVLMRISH